MLSNLKPINMRDFLTALMMSNGLWNRSLTQTLYIACTLASFTQAVAKNAIVMSDPLSTKVSGVIMLEI